ncbi:MAG: PAS domain S-box protein [Haloferacaceae archaeon]
MPPEEGAEGAREWHREVVETAPVPVAVYDADGVIQYVNDAAVAFVNGGRRDAVVGRRAVEFVAPEERDRIAERVRRVIEERESVAPTEAAFVATDGERKHAVTAGAPVTYEGAVAGQAILNDVTERKARERRLQRERDRFETLFENLPTPVTHGVARDGEPIVRRVNRRFEEVFGYDREEVEGENLDELIVPPDRRSEADRINRRILSEGRVRAEVRRETADGLRDFLLHIVVRNPEAEEPEGYAIYVDITERKAVRRELERQNERLEEFASVVAHDLRNPLSVARAHLDLVREGSAEGDLDGVDRAHDRMERIIDDLLTLARQGETVTDPEPVALDGVARRAWDTVATPGAALRVDGGARLSADPDRLRELFENLFRNSVEHGSTGNRTESGDSVEHGSTDSREDDGAGAAGGSGDGDGDGDGEGGGAAAVTVAVGPLDGQGFYVEDDGPGIPPEKRDRVFESGYTTDEDGTGFGLTIVRRIAEAHGWAVRVTEASDGGARFEFAPERSDG